MVNNEINEILEKNRIFNDDYNLVEVNNKEEFLKNYKFNRTDIHKIPKGIVRNNNGFLILDNVPFVSNFYLGDGHNQSYWLLLSNGSKIFLKSVEYDEICMELLFQELANSLDIPSAKYDVATLNDKIYLASNCFISTEDLIFDYYDVERKKEVLIEDLMLKACEIKQEQFVKEMLTIDLLTNHKDRFPYNFRTILRNKQNIICPLYDNGLCGLDEKVRKGYILPTYQGSNNFIDIISFLLTDEHYRNWCLNYVIKEDVSLYKGKILMEKGICIDQDINDIFVENVNNGQSLIIKKL